MMVVMIRFITRIGIVALLTCVSAFGAMADDNYVYPPGAEPFDYGENYPPELPKFSPYDEVDVPDKTIRLAYKDFTGTSSKLDPIRALNELRTFVLDKRLDKVRENLDWAIAQGWDKGFIDLFRRAIEWGDHIWHSDGAYVWAQSKIEENLSPHDSHKRVKWSLERIAIKKEYAPAIFNYVMKEYFNPESTSYNPMLGRYRLSDIADKGFEPALQQLVERYLTGHVLKKHLGAAYYWLKRGEQFGFDLTPWRSRVEKQVSEQDRAWADKILTSGHYPRDKDFKRH